MKRLLLTLLLVVVTTLQTPAHARPRLYYYDGDIPMITFMLNMMVAMGVIDRVPRDYRHGGYGSYGGIGKYSRFGRNGRYGRYGRYDDLQGRYPGKYNKRYPLSLYRDFYPDLPWERLDYERWDGPSDHPYLRNQLVCDDWGCYRRSPLDGVWLSSSGEILGIKYNRMVWSDGDESYAVGLIRTTPEHIYARINGASTSTPYSYRLAGNQLNLRDIDGSVRRFYRLPGSDKPRLSSRY